MYKTIITEPAELDIIRAVQYIAGELLNPFAAEGLLDDIESSISSLGKTPKRHGLIRNEQLALAGFRFMPIRNYMLFYIAKEDTNTVVIERFLHSRRDWIHIIG